MKIIIYGYKLYSHTHSHIHNGFFRSFQWLGHDVMWVDKNDDLSSVDLKGAIFLTAAQADEGIPKRKDCKYILHNCGDYEGIGKRLNIQYLTYESYQFEQIAPGITYKDGCLYFPWGSPFLPHEFNEADLENEREKDVYFLGTVNGPLDGGNYNSVSNFAAACRKDGRKFIAGGGYTGATQNKDITYIDGWISEGDQSVLLRKAYMAPALQGKNQLKNGMIPCRIFKAISHGGDGITNNALVYNFFDREVIYNPDCFCLYEDAKQRAGERERKRWLFNEVRTKHTYIERCKAILNIL